jgi:hypothetical protein
MIITELLLIITGSMTSSQLLFCSSGLRDQSKARHPRLTNKKAVRTVTLRLFNVASPAESLFLVNQQAS